MQKARKIAMDILDNKINPNKGCAQISEIAISLDWPSKLIDFTLIAHEQTDHEHLGITLENVQPDIIKAAKKLLKS